MAEKISSLLGVSEEVFAKTGACNIIVGLDSKFHIDPFLLQKTKIPELENAYAAFQNYFRQVISLLENSTQVNDRLWREAEKRLIFKEVSYINLGYSKKSNKGNAIGAELARVICNSAAEIIKSGIKDPIIFELVGLFEERIGADRISDMTGQIILEYLLNYTQRILYELKIENTTKVTYNDKEYTLPIYTEPVVLLPMEILSDLPIAYSWEEIDLVCAHNEEIRNKVNNIIGTTWANATNHTKVNKRQLKYVLLHEPEALKDLITLYKGKEAIGYDFERDPLGETIWLDISKSYTTNYTFDLKEFKPLGHSEFIQVIHSICEKYGQLIEHNGLFKMLYTDRMKIRHERFPQLLFYGIADSYCEANNLDINREANAGRGSVDFKFSQGYTSRINVEVKYSTNNKLLSGYSNQLKIYNQAEKTFFSIYLVLQITDNYRPIDKLLKLRSDALNKGERAPEIIIIDARNKNSASV